MMPTSELRILLVEDNPGDARLVREVLRDIPGVQCQLTHATRLADALDIVGTESFDIGLLDLGLPDAVGIEAVQRLHQAAPSLALVVLSALNDERVAIQSLQEGSQDYLVKADIDNHLLWRALRYAMERQRLQLEVQSLSLVDDLTGLSNRKGFITLASHHVNIARRSGLPFLVGFVDLDDMKYINDTFGHQEGNRALVEVAGTLKDSLRQSDILGRFGGDEFVVLIANANEHSAATVRHRIFEKVTDRNARPGRRYALSLSIGLVSSHANNPPSLDELLAAADLKMYEDKREKRASR